jgi:hypothetical protein
VGISRIEKVAIVQGGLIAQSYALLSGVCLTILLFWFFCIRTNIKLTGNPKVRDHFAIAEAFHGLVLYVGLFCLYCTPLST